MGSELIRAFQRDVIEGSMESRKFFLSLKDEPRESAIAFCRWVVSNITYEKHPVIIKAAFDKLAHLRDIPSLEPLAQLREEWTNTYLNEYEYLIALMENAQTGAKCNCNVYQDGKFNVPPYQDDLEEIGTGKRDHDGFIQTDLIYVLCRTCESEWEVEIDYTYHYPHSHWRRNN